MIGSQSEQFCQIFFRFGGKPSSIDSETMDREEGEQMIEGGIRAW